MIGQMPDVSGQHLTQHALPQVIHMSEAAPSKAASELAAMIQETQSNLALVLERVAIATSRGLDDAIGVGSGSGEPVGGTRDFTQNMLDKLGGGGSKKIRDDDGKIIAVIPTPLERDDDARKHLAMLVASIGAARDWSQRAKSETFRLTPLSQAKAKLLMGDGPTKCLNGNCARDVWRTPQDPLRAGRCEACYRYWDRHDRTEERPKHLCDAANLVTWDKKSATTEDASGPSLRESQ